MCLELTACHQRYKYEPVRDKITNEHFLFICDLVSLQKCVCRADDGCYMFQLEISPVYCFDFYGDL